MRSQKATADYRLGHDLRSVASRARDRVAVRDRGVETTYSELAELSERVAAGLREAGTGPGDRVVVLTREALAVLATVHGAALLGAVTVPANWRLSAAELSAVVADSGARVLVVDDALSSLAADCGGVTTMSADLADWPEEAPVDPGPPGEVAVQIYTSGTSGEPKGVLITAANLACKVRAMAADWAIGASSTSMMATPLFHIGGLSWALVTLSAGGTLVVPDSTRAADVASTVLDQGVTHAFLVPKLMTDLVHVLDERGVESTPLEVVLCGAAPVSVDLQRLAVSTLGSRVLQVYGLTETTGSITQLEVADALADVDPEAALRTSGHPYPWVEVEIRDPDDQSPCPPGTPGEVWTRSGQNCAGYWQREEETDHLLVDGWLRTGDGGLLDQAGRLRVTDRLKDMIVSGGENIYSVEVETALQRHPAVRDVAVVGRPDEQWGEAVVAVVELQAGASLSTEEAAEHVATSIGRYKRPREVVVVEQLPRNASGKVLKRQVKLLVAAPTPPDPTDAATPTIPAASSTSSTSATTVTETQR